MDIDDWRYHEQETYLLGVTLRRKKYAERKTKTDHDHCEFCGAKFSDSIPGALTEGHATTDDYQWICDDCYSDFKDEFKWLVSENA